MTVSTFFAQEAAGTAIAEGLTGWIQPMVEEFTKLGTGFVAYVPTLILGLVTFIIGFLFAKLVRFVIRTIGTKLKLDTVAESLGISDLLRKFGVKATLPALIATIFFWIIFIYFLKVTADILGVDDISNFVSSFIAFLPKLAVAIVILMAGLLAADLVRGFVRNGLEAVGVEYAGMIAKFCYGLLAVMILTVVLGQLGIQTELLNAAVKIILAAVGLAVALALGLGLRPVTKNVVTGVYARDIYTPGSIVNVDGTDATVVEVGPVATRLEVGEGRFLVVPNSKLVTETNEGRYRISGLTEKETH